MNGSFFTITKPGIIGFKALCFTKIITSTDIDQNIYSSNQIFEKGNFIPDVSLSYFNDYAVGIFDFKDYMDGSYVNKPFLVMDKELREPMEIPDGKGGMKKIYDGVTTLSKVVEELYKKYDSIGEIFVYACMGGNNSILTNCVYSPNFFTIKGVNTGDYIEIELSKILKTNYDSMVTILTSLKEGYNTIFFYVKKDDKNYNQILNNLKKDNLNGWSVGLLGGGKLGVIEGKIADFEYFNSIFDINKYEKEDGDLLFVKKFDTEDDLRSFRKILAEKKRKLRTRALSIYGRRTDNLDIISDELKFLSKIDIYKVAKTIYENLNNLGNGCKVDELKNSIKNIIKKFEDQTPSVINITNFMCYIYMFDQIFKGKHLFDSDNYEKYKSYFSESINNSIKSLLSTNCNNIKKINDYETMKLLFGFSMWNLKN